MSGRLFPDDVSAKISQDVPRSLPVSETYARLAAVRGRLPVTRLADLTPLDRLGIPVFCAVTPLARDLTTHMGKGLDPMSARVSALMEAVERLSAETAPADRLRSSFLALDTALDPRASFLPPDTGFRPEVPIGWLPGRDVRDGAPVLIAADLVCSPPSDGVLHQPDTNGLASGNTRLEALIHGLCEVIERDAAGRVLFAELYAEPGDPAPMARAIDPRAGLPDQAGALVETILSQDLGVMLDDLTQDIAVPVLRATIVDPDWPTASGPQLRLFPGLGCDPNAGIALTRALTEAAQSRLALLQGARDSFNRVPRRRREHSRRSALAGLSGPSGRGGVPFSAIPSQITTDLEADLARILRALSDAGFDQACFADLTRDGIGLPVLRVVVPGLSVFFVDRSRVSARDLACLV